MKSVLGLCAVGSVVATAMAITAVAEAQDGNVGMNLTSCTDAKPPAVNPANTLAAVRLFIIPPGASGHRALCRATEALAEGMVDIAFANDKVLSEVLGGPDTIMGEV